MNNKSIMSLQVLRGFAAILVLLFHGSAMIEKMLGYSYATNALRIGSSGVDIFFVLSGFIIYYTSTIKEITPKEFFMRRFVRIFPIYWVALIFVCGTFLFEYFIVESQNSTVVKTIQDGGLDLLFRSIFLIPIQSRPLISVAWSLSYEIVFYLLFGLFFFRSPKKFICILAFWVTFNFLNYFCLQCQTFFHPIVAWVDLSNPIILEFLYGCIIAIIVTKYEKFQVHKYANISLLIGCLFLIATVFLQEWISNHMHIRMFIYGLPATLIVYGAIYLKYPSPRFLTYLGDASYSIYLFHLPFLGTIIKLLFMFKINNLFSNFFGTTSILLFLTFLCCCMYNFIEKPILEFGRIKINEYIFRSKIRQFALI